MQHVSGFPAACFGRSSQRVPVRFFRGSCNMFCESPRSNEFSGMPAARFRGIHSAFPSGDRKGVRRGWWGVCSEVPRSPGRVMVDLGSRNSFSGGNGSGLPKMLRGKSSRTLFCSTAGDEVPATCNRSRFPWKVSSCILASVQIASLKLKITSGLQKLLELQNHTFRSIFLGSKVFGNMIGAGISDDDEDVENDTFDEDEDADGDAPYRNRLVCYTCFVFN